MDQALKTKIDQIAKHALDKKAENVCIIDLTDQGTLTDVMMFCDAKNEPQIDAIAKNIHEKMKDKITQTGTKDSHWVILDVGDVIVHIMTPETRQFYNLEALWNKGGITYYE